MDAAKSNGFNRVRGVVILACAVLLTACSREPQEPAPVFALPVNKIVTGPPAERQGPAAPVVKPAAPQLRYVAIPPGRKVEGMAHAHVVLKGAAAPVKHRHKAKIAAGAKHIHSAAARTTEANVQAEPKAGDREAIPLDDPAPNTPTGSATER